MPLAEAFVLWFGATSHYIYLANFALLFAMWEKGSKLSVKCQSPSLIDGNAVPPPRLCVSSLAFA